jgi:hypothetical protein
MLPAGQPFFDTLTATNCEIHRRFKFEPVNAARVRLRSLAKEYMFATFHDARKKTDEQYASVGTTNAHAFCALGSDADNCVHLFARLFPSFDEVLEVLVPGKVFSSNYSEALMLESRLASVWMADCITPCRVSLALTSLPLITSSSAAPRTARDV